MGWAWSSGLEAREAYFDWTQGFNICPSGWAGFDSAKPAIAASPCLLWMGARYTSTRFLLGFPCIWFGLFLPLVVSEKRPLRHTMTQPSSRFLRVHYLSTSYALPSTNDLLQEWFAPGTVCPRKPHQDPPRESLTSVARDDSCERESCLSSVVPLASTSCLWEQLISSLI